VTVHPGIGMNLLMSARLFNPKDGADLLNGDELDAALSKEQA
jgi:hypothetical protein